MHFCAFVCISAALGFIQLLIFYLTEVINKMLMKIISKRYESHHDDYLTINCKCSALEWTIRHSANFTVKETYFNKFYLKLLKQVLDIFFLSGLSPDV